MAKQGIQLSEQTAQKLKGLLRKATSSAASKTSGRGTGRYVTHVRVTGPDVDGVYPCVPTFFDPQANSWVEFDQQRAIPANGETLTEDARYVGVCYGTIVEGPTQYLLFVADDSVIEAGCGIVYEGGELNINPDDFAGDGLTTEEDSDSDSGCPKLNINPACGLLIDEDNKLGLDVEAVFNGGCFLSWNAGNEGAPGGTSDCPQVTIDVSRAFSIDIPYLEDVTVGITGCTGTLTKTPKTLRIWRNGCELLTGAEVISAEPVTSTFAIGCCCDDSDSGYCDGWYCHGQSCFFIENCKDVEDGFVGPFATQEECAEVCDFDCAGWWCCPATGTVVFFENCEEANAYVCEEDETDCGTGCAWYYYTGGLIPDHWYYAPWLGGCPDECGCDMPTEIPEQGPGKPQWVITRCTAGGGGGDPTGIAMSGPYDTEEEALAACGGDSDSDSDRDSDSDSDSDSDGCESFPGAGWYCHIGVCTFLDNCLAWQTSGEPTPKYPDNTCGGACGVMPMFLAPAPQTLTVTSASGNVPSKVTWNGSEWAGNGLVISCRGDVWSAVYTGEGGTATGTAEDATRDPVSVSMTLVFTSGERVNVYITE